MLKTKTILKYKKEMYLGFSVCREVPGLSVQYNKKNKMESEDEVGVSSFCYILIFLRPVWSELGVILSHSQFKEWHVRLTKVHLKPLSDHRRGTNCYFSSLKIVC